MALPKTLILGPTWLLPAFIAVSLAPTIVAHRMGRHSFNHVHIWTRLKKESEGKTGLGIYPDGMVEHDAMVGQLLDKLKELGLEDNTIVMYSTDNGAAKFIWPDGGQSPFRGEKNTNWEGGLPRPDRHSAARRHQARHRVQ